MNKILQEIKKLNIEELEKLHYKIQYFLLNKMFPKNKKGEREKKKN